MRDVGKERCTEGVCAVAVRDRHLRERRGRLSNEVVVRVAAVALRRWSGGKSNRRWWRGHATTRRSGWGSWWTEGDRSRWTWPSGDAQVLS